MHPQLGCKTGMLEPVEKPDLSQHRDRCGWEGRTNPKSRCKTPIESEM